MSIRSGLYPAVTTKLTADGALDLPATQASLERLIAAGVDGVVMLPMLGENAALTAAERERVLRAGAEAIGGRVPMLSGLSATSTEAVRETARAMRGWGAEGFMAFPCLGYRTDARETVAWYRAIAGATDLPVMIYNNPIAYGVDVTPAVLERLANVPEIVCIKEESGDVRRVTDLMNALGDRFAVFCGVDDQLLESVALGSTGWVSGMTNAFPQACIELFALCRAGRFAEALPLYRLLTPAFHLDTDVKLVQYIKLAEHVTAGAPEWCRAPRLPLEGAERTEVLTVVETTRRDLAEYNARRGTPAAGSAPRDGGPWVGVATPADDVKSTRMRLGFLRSASLFADRFNTVLTTVAAVLLAISTAAVLLQVIIRFVLPLLGLNVSAPWTEEVARYMMMWVVFLGVAVLCRHARLIAVEIVALLLPRPLGVGLKMVAVAICIAFFAILTKIGIDWIGMSGIERSPVLQIPMNSVYLALPVGGILAIFNLLVFMAESLTGLRDPLAGAAEAGD